VDRLETRERELQAAKEELEHEAAAVKLDRERMALLAGDLEAQRKRFRAEALEKLKEQQRNALHDLDAVTSAYKKKLSSVEEKHIATKEAQADVEIVKETFRELEKKVDEIAPPPAYQPDLPLPAPADEPVIRFEQNGPVKIPSMGTEGVLLTNPNDLALRKRPAEVMVGIMRMKISWDQLEPRARSRPKAGSRPYATASDHAEAPPELHLLGKTVDEARSLLEQYLDRASRSGRPWVRVVHGHGSGALKKMVREVLRTTPYGVKHRPGTASEGGEGCTVVEFV
jgi:DNA mismatch repair protein MutS2